MTPALICRSTQGAWLVSHAEGQKNQTNAQFLSPHLSTSASLSCCPTPQTVPNPLRLHRHVKFGVIALCFRRQDTYLHGIVRAVDGARAISAQARFSGSENEAGRLVDLFNTEKDASFAAAVEHIPTTEADCQALLDWLIQGTRSLGTSSGINVVAFSGGVDSSLAAFLVKIAFPDGAAYACIGRSAALPLVQLESARQVAAAIGIPLHEVETGEGHISEYVANEGASCYHCKTALYSTLRSVAQALPLHARSSADVVLFNGTNADDLRDPTRLGLLAALQCQVASPLAALPKAAVRAVARHAGLPNWNLAAAPCLRSRLDFGVAATAEALAAVEAAEDTVRQRLKISSNENMRVRVLAGNTAIIEVDGDKLEAALTQESLLAHELGSIGLQLDQIRAFKSGSLSHQRQPAQ